MNRKAPLFAFTLALLFAASHAARAQGQQPPSQQPEDVLQVNTRVVFLDALVTDGKTKATASDLAAANFEVLADGRKREVSYFTREGDAARRPLALVLVFDLERLGAGRYLRRTDILEAMARELERLPPGDEVAVVAQDAGGEGRREWLTPFTRNRAQIASALSIIPTLVGDGGGDGSLTISAGTGGTHVSTADSDTPPGQPNPALAREEELIKKARKGDLDDGDELDTAVNAKGEKLTRVLKADGTLVVTKTDRKGEEESEVYNDFDLPRAAYEITKRVARERPNSQGAIVYVTDGIAPMQYDERDYVESRLIRRNVIFSALVTDMKTGFKLAKPLLAPLGNLADISIYGVAQHVAKASGGDVVRVHSPNDYAKGLSRIIGNLNARYSLGFALAEAETDDGRMHPLEVRVAAKDAKGRDRKLEIKARKSYYMPAAPKQQEAKKADAAKSEAQTKN
jgi:VWFA-related protein